MAYREQAGIAPTMAYAIPIQGNYAAQAVDVNVETIGGERVIQTVAVDSTVGEFRQSLVQRFDNNNFKIMLGGVELNNDRKTLRDLNVVRGTNIQLLPQGGNIGGRL